MTNKREKVNVQEPTKGRPDQLLIDERYLKNGDAERLLALNDESGKKTFADALTARAKSQPEVRAAVVIQKYEGDTLNVNALVNELREQVAEVQKGDMRRPEAMLVAQSHVLDALFSNLAKRCHANASAGYLDAADRYMRLALRAQAQSVKTIEVLGELKNPRPVAFVNQANIAHNQQVNNGFPARAQERQNEQIKLSEESNELLPYAGAPSITCRDDSALETMAEINGTNIGGR